MAKTSNYQHYCKDVELVDFLSITKRHLVESLKELDYLLNDKYKDKQFMSFDIETILPVLFHPLDSKIN